MVKAKWMIVVLCLAITVPTACSPQNTLPPPSTATLAQPTPSLVAPTLSVAEQFTPVPWYLGGFEGLRGGGYGSPDLRPAGLAVSPDGSLFVTTTANSFIFHLDPYGNIIKAWGGFKKVGEKEKAPPGFFNEPWGIALSPEGFIYITDTWNHRIQKFTQQGEFVLEWGEGGIGNHPYQFFGPRGIACDFNGRVIVADTGNHRVVVYDKNGSFISQLGGEGAGLGQFNEPVGVAVDSQNTLFVADFWNSRIQVIQIAADGALTPKSAWKVEGWGSQSIQYKPFLAVSKNQVYATDPEHNLILRFSSNGDVDKTIELKTRGLLADGIVTGIASDPTGGIWVSDYKYNLWSHLNP